VPGLFGFKSVVALSYFDAVEGAPVLRKRGERFLYGTSIVDFRFLAVGTQDAMGARVVGRNCRHLRRHAGLQGLAACMAGPIFPMMFGPPVHGPTSRHTCRGAVARDGDIE
jgi:hypothetical protein